jgi:hypothetical protein
MLAQEEENIVESTNQIIPEEAKEFVQNLTSF